MQPASVSFGTNNGEHTGEGDDCGEGVGAKANRCCRSCFATTESLCLLPQAELALLTSLIYAFQVMDLIKKVITNTTLSGNF